MDLPPGHSEEVGLSSDLSVGGGDSKGKGISFNAGTFLGVALTS